MFEVDRELREMERILAELSGDGRRTVRWIFADDMVYAFSQVFADRNAIVNNENEITDLIKEVATTGVGLVLDAFGETDKGEIVASAVPAWTPEQGGRFLACGVRYAVAPRLVKVVPVSPWLLRILRNFATRRPDWDVYPLRDPNKWRLAPDRVVDGC